jgi:hypothetical protein
MIDAVTAAQHTGKRQESRDVIKILRQNNRFKIVGHKNICLFYYKHLRPQRAILLMIEAVKLGLMDGMINAILTDFSAYIMQMQPGFSGLGRGLSKSMYPIRHIIPDSLPVNIRIIAGRSQRRRCCKH